jgi:hypothetical protein
MRKSQDFFVWQQGFDVPNANPHLYAALMLQPRLIGVLVIVGSIVDSHELYLLLAAILAWGTLVPTHNAFDALYNRLIASPRGLPRLESAPAPRRFAQGVAALLAFAIGVAFLAEATITARLLEGVFLIGVASAVVRRFCLPAHLYHVLRRRVSPAAGVSDWPPARV